MDATEARPVPIALEGSTTLSHWGLMRARGADAAKFLHSQFSNDVLGLSPGGLRLAGFCSAKGRLQASFQVWRPAPESFLLACHATVLPATLKRLSMFVLRSQCRLSDAALGVPASSTEPALPGLQCTGLMGEAARRAMAAVGLSPTGPGGQQRGADGGSLLGLPSVAGVARAVWVAPAGQAAPGALAQEAPLPLAHWCWLEVRSGVPQIEAATVDQFVPQMLNFELIGGVDFQKGCYPGQEVVARSQYRGTVKRRMFLFDVEGSAAAGAEVFHSADPAQPAGMVVNAAPQPGASTSSLLVEVKLAALAGGSLHLGGPDGPRLRRSALPYPVPAEGEVEA